MGERKEERKYLDWDELDVAIPSLATYRWVKGFGEIQNWLEKVKICLKCEKFVENCVKVLTVDRKFVE